MTVRLRIQHDDPHSAHAVKLLVHDSARQHTGRCYTLQPGKSTTVHVYPGQCVTATELPLPGETPAAAAPVRAAG